MINLDDTQGSTGLLPRLPGTGPSWPNLGQDEPMNVQQEYMAQRRALENDRLSKLYTDEKEFARLSNDSRVRESSRLSLLGNDLPKVGLNAAYLSHQLGRKVTASEYEIARDHFAASQFGKEAVTDGQFFDLVKGQYDLRNQKIEAVRELRLRMAAQSLEDGIGGAQTPVASTWTAWKEKHAELLDGEEDLPYLAAAVADRNDFQQVVDKYKGLAAPGLALLKRFTAGETDSQDMADFARTLAESPVEDQDKVIDLIALAADGGQIDRGAIKEFARSMGQTFMRGFNFIPQRGMQDAQVAFTEVQEVLATGDVWLQGSGEPTLSNVQRPGNTRPVSGVAVIDLRGRRATPEEIEQLKVDARGALDVLRIERQLRAVADNNVDPIKRLAPKGTLLGALEGGVLGVAGSLPLLTATAVNPFAGMMAYQSMEFDRMMFENPNMNVRAAEGISLIEGAWQAALDRLQLKTLQGALPVTGRLLGKVKSTGLRRTLGFAASGAEQFGQELLQDIGTMGIDALASAVREDMKDKSFTFELGEYWKNDAPEVLVASLIFGLWGGGAITSRELRGTSAEWDEAARVVGISEQGRERMKAATTPEELDAVVERELKSVTPEARAAGALYAKAKAQSAAAAQADPNEPTLEVGRDTEGNTTYTIRTPDDQVLIETKDPQAAQAAFLDYRTASQNNEVESLRQAIDVWQNREKGLEFKDAPGVLVTEELGRLEGIGDTARIEQLRQRLVAADIDPDGDLAGVQIFGSVTVEDVGQGVYQGTSLLRQGATPETVFEEGNHYFVRRALLRGDVTLDTLTGWLDQTAAATGLDIKRGNEIEVIESIAQVGMDLFNGRLDQAQIPQGLMDYFRRLMRVVKEIYVRAVKVTEAFDKGEIDGNFEQFLMESMGLSPQQQIDTNSTTNAAAVATGQPVEDFSIGRSDRLPAGRTYLDEVDRVLDLPDKPASVETSPFEGGKVRTIAKLFQRMIGADGRIEFGSLDEPGAQEKVDQAGDRILEVLRRAAYEFPNFASWYESRLKMALDIFEQIDPDVAKEDNRAALLVVLAITSNGADVRTQTFDGWDVYRHWKKTGQLAGAPEKSGALRGKATENKLVAADKMARALGGYAQLGQFLSRKGTVGDLRKAMAEELGGAFTKDQINKLTNGELVSEVVPFSLVFGPKLGSFYNNMSGDFSTVTMDRWFMRTFGRAMGTQLAAVSRQTLADKDKRLREAIKPYKGDLLQRAGIRKNTSDPRKIAVALGKFFQKEENRSKLTKQEDEIRKAANDLFKVADGLALIEAPSTGTHRRWIRAVMANALEKFNAQTDKPLVPAEAQALLWYYEKLVHETYGSRQKDSSPDYASSANQLYLREKGVRSDRFRDSDGIERRPGGGRSAAFGGLRASGPQGVEDFSVGRPRVDRALSAALNRKPGERLAMYERAKEMFDRVAARRGELPEEPGETTAGGLERIEADKAAKLAEIDRLEEIDIAEAQWSNLEKFNAEAKADQDERTRKDAQRKARERGRILERGIRDKYDEQRKAVEAGAKAQRMAAENAAKADSRQRKLDYQGNLKFSRALQGLWELDAILKVLPAEVRGKVGGFTSMAALGKDSPTGPTQEAVDKFLDQRLEMIGKQLDRYLAAEYRIAIGRALEAAKPKRSESGVRKSTLGPETQAYADKALAASNLDNDQTAARLAAIEAELLNPETKDEARIDLVEEWGLVNTLGDLDSRNAETLAQAYAELRDRFKAGRAGWRIQEEARIAGQRETVATLLAGFGEPTKAKRFAQKSQVQELVEKLSAVGLDHGNFEQVLRAVFGDHPVVEKWSTMMRKSDNGDQDMEMAMRDQLLDAIKTAAKAAGMRKGQAFRLLKTKSALKVRALDGKPLPPERISIELAQKIVRGTADRSNLTAADVAILREKLDELPPDTRKEFITFDRAFVGNPSVVELTPAQAIQLELSWDQPDVQEKMRREGWTDESIEDIRAITSQPVAAETLAFLRKFYAENYATVNPIYARMFGMNMPQAKFYAPSRYKSVEKKDDIGLDGSPQVTGSTPGFAKSRVGHSAPIDPVDALTVFQQHAVQTAHWIHFAEFSREVRGVLSNLPLQEAIEQKFGRPVLQSLQAWLDQIEQRGANKSREMQWMNAAMGAYLSGTSVSSLGFNLRTVAINSDSGLRFLWALTPQQIGSALMTPAKLAQAMPKVWFSPSVQRRIKGGSNPAAQFVFTRGAAKPGPFSTLGWFSFQPVQWYDAAATTFSSAMVFQATYNDAMAAGLGEVQAEAAALEAVDAVIYRYSQPTGFGSKSNVENTSGAFGKLLTLFMSDPRLKTGVMLEAVREIGRGKDVAMNVQKLLVVETLAIVSHVIASAYRDAFSDDEDEDIWSPEGFALAMVLAPFQGLFLAGAVTETAFRMILGMKTWAPPTAPYAGNIESLGGAVRNWEQLFSPDTFADGVNAWNRLLRGLAINAPFAAPAALLNMIKPFVGLQENLEADE